MRTRFTALALAAMLGLPAAASAHTMLVRAEPAKGSTLASCPSRVLLVFSEPLEPAMTRVTVAGVKLVAAGDPHNVKAVIAPLTCLPPGTHEVSWHVVSADGHPVNGTYSFTVLPVAGALDSSPPVVALPVVDSAAQVQTADLKPDTAGLVRDAPSDVPYLAALLRGAAVLSLMALFGLTFFRNPPRSRQRGTAELPLAIVAPLFLAAHLALWMMNADEAHRLTTAALSTVTGRLELARLALAVLALWALWLGRRPKLAMVFAGSALAVSGAIGHAVVIHPEGTIAAKALHLLAGGLWLGGLLHLLTIPRGDSSLFTRQVSRVSNLAFASVIVIVLSGVVQWRYFLPTFDLLHSTYGILLLAKLGGMLVLLAFGAHHRYRVIPRLQRAGRFNATLRAEVYLMLVVAVLGAFLAYTPPAVQ
jgi:copper transport protein